MARVGRGMHEPAERLDIGGRADHETHGDPHQDQGEHGDPDRLVHEQHFGPEFGPRQLGRPDAERQRNED